jgi:hypothetical protein
MKLQRTLSCITGVLMAVGFAASQASAGTGPDCGLEIEINALRGGSPTVTVNATKNITAKARISKGSAPDGTVIDTTLRIDTIDATMGDIIDSQFSTPIRLGIGKGGQGDKLGMLVPSCENPAGVIFKATFQGIENSLCKASRVITKTCK